MAMRPKPARVHRIVTRVPPAAVNIRVGLVAPAGGDSPRARKRAEPLWFGPPSPEIHYDPLQRSLQVPVGTMAQKPWFASAKRTLDAAHLCCITTNTLIS